MRNKHFIRIVVIFGVSLLLLIGICILGVFGLKEKRYYANNYHYTLLKVSNFTVSQESCSICSENIFIQKTYKGYINVTYNVNNILYYSSFTKDEFCTDSYNSSLFLLQERYHQNDFFYIWYFISDPSIWIFQRPVGEAYIVCSVFLFFFFLFAIFIGCIFLIRDKKYLVTHQENVNFQEILF